MFKSLYVTDYHLKVLLSVNIIEDSLSGRRRQPDEPKKETYSLISEFIGTISESPLHQP
jgi:hypothetical protein